MNILALDACGRYAITALTRGSEALYASSSGGEGAVRSVYVSVDRAMESAGLAPAQLDAIVVNTGPGSWTGARIAVTYTASLAFAAPAPVFGFSGFEIGKRLGGVAFQDQLGKTISDARAGAAGEGLVNLFPEISAEDYLAQRRVWLDKMLVMGREALASGASGDPLELQTTYFQEFLAGARS